MPDPVLHEAERITREPTWFSRIARGLTRAAGSRPWVAFVLAFALVWSVVGTAAGFPRWWELVVTVGVPFLTLLLLALIQHSQNHDSNAIALKLDELISSVDGASLSMLRVEEASESDLTQLQEHYGRRVAATATASGPPRIALKACSAE